MIIFIFIMITSSLCCELCDQGPINLSTNFSVYGTRLEQLYINSDSVFINNNKTMINFFNVNAFKCSFYSQKLESLSSLRRQSSYVQLISDEWSTYQADWAYTVVYNGVGNNSCSFSNFYQLTMMTDQRASFILVQYYKTDFNHNFYFGFNSPFIKRYFITNHSQLVLNSNIGIKGKWIYLVDIKNQKKFIGNNSNFINFNFKLIFLLFLNKYMFMNLFSR